MNSPKRVLLIDDDEDDSFFFETALSGLDHPVLFTYDQDCEAALKKLKDHSAPALDLLFLDWNMPKINGRECLAAIRNMPAYASLPIIVYTTSKAHADKIEAQQLGASYFLSKPPTIRELTKKLKDLFSVDWSTEPNA